MAKKNSGKGLSRRSFIRTLGLGTVTTAATVAVAPLSLPSKALASQKEGPYGDQGEELATLHDLSKCVGCGECVTACKESNAHKFPEPRKPFPKMYPKRVKVEDWSEKRDVEDRLTPYNWLTLQTANVEYEGEEYEINIPRRCMHCVNPPCANLCPWGAAEKQGNGVVRINDSICLGGSKCKAVCPWKIPQRQTGVGLYLDILPRFAGNGVMFKCDRCYDKLEKGEQPACITACPEDVQTIGPRSEIVKKAHELAESMNGFIYGETENGGTNTIYVSPVPFELLNKAIEKGPGLPHMKNVDDLMGKEENLVAAAMLAPVAGLAAGALNLIRSAKKDKADEEGENG